MSTIDRAVLVTGSSSGIGAAVARAFAAEGASVAVTSSTSREAGEAVADEIGGIYEQADIARPDDVAGMVERTVDRLGRLDVLVNCAGTTAEIAHDDIAGASVEVWRRIFDVNVFGTWSVISNAVGHLQATGSGLIVNVTSTSATRPAGSSIPYAASKAAVNHTTALLAKALGPQVRVNAVAPGLIDTPWSAGWEDIHRHVAETVALRRVGTPEDVAATCVLIDKSPYLTGAVIPVDGGLSLL